ncbi:PREDICTED: glutathione S-transferase kappa 1-like [Branchiostoma belcheri]|uniref:Glutathione S-transferase kappa n=1 Tax=Branchiostoma belcheri TaxID=7741 RepID=A0A6P4Z2C9_BRABE|nr:PREDICTED: glutathione S-transferase kappa 1-like [Branchiostoma belcheri]
MAAPTRKSVEFFYDVLSPYTWLAFEVMCRYQQKWNIDLKLRPFFLSGIMQGADNRPPGMVPAKATYMGKDLRRLTDMYKVPFKMPSNPAEVMFIKGSINAGRFLTAVDMNCDQYLEELTRQLFLRIYYRDEDITEPASLMSAAAKAGIPEDLAKQLLSTIKDQAVKDRLRQTTQTALDHGAFGSPTIVAHIDGKPQMFFGSDRLELMAHMLGEKWHGPLTELAKAKM